MNHHSQGLAVRYAGSTERKLCWKGGKEKKKKEEKMASEAGYVVKQPESGQPVSGQYKSTRTPRGWLLATTACSCQIVSSWRGGESMVLNRGY